MSTSDWANLDELNERAEDDMTTTKDALPPVYVRLKRPEGYEDVHPELLIEDAHINPAFEPEDVTAEVAALASKQAPADLREIECPPDPDVVDRALSERPRLSPYDAVARAMDLASLLAGSVGMNNKEQANAYSSRLRRHLIEYVYPATSAEAQAKSEPVASDARDAARYRHLRQYRDVSLATMFFGNGCINKYRDHVDEAIDAAIAATQEQKP